MANVGDTGVMTCGTTPLRLSQPHTIDDVEEALRISSTGCSVAPGGMWLPKTEVDMEMRLTRSLGHPLLLRHGEPPCVR